MLLLLAGTGEAMRLAQALADEDIPAVASLSGGARPAHDLPLPLRCGGFGGDAGFAAYLETQGVTAVLDATHPFAARISNRTARICAERGLPYCQLLRPGWTEGPGDNWVFIDREEEAARHIGSDEVVFLATGRQRLARFANLAPRRVYCRRIGASDAAFPFPGGQFLVGTPPFPVADEVALFDRLGIDWLVVKNAGGSRSRTKLTAARDLRIRVLMLRRPAPPKGAPRAETVEAAMEWVRAL